MSDSEPIRFYWSFRSPYAWLAITRIDEVFGSLPIELRWIPVYPPPDMPNNPTNVPNKLRYIWEDVGRFADVYGLKVVKPPAGDPNWAVSHSAYLYARSEGRGREFVDEGFAARFSRGQDLGNEETLSEIARKVGLDPARVLGAHAEPRFGGELLEGFKSGLDDGLFGVPTFIYRGQMFWGNDRMEWLADRIRHDLA